MVTTTVSLINMKWNMNDITKEIDLLIADTEAYMLSLSNDELEYRYALGKWSKKEILGHLIDSAINNLQRFTEIQYSAQPYQTRDYDQDELVRVNHYHQADIKGLLKLWASLNRRIIHVVDNLTINPVEAMLAYGEGNGNLKWLIIDYVTHMKHHLLQIHGEPSTYIFEPKVLD